MMTSQSVPARRTVRKDGVQTGGITRVFKPLKTVNSLSDGEKLVHTEIQ